MIGERIRVIRDRGAVLSDSGGVISDVVARIRSPGGSISALESRVERVCSGHPALFVCASSKTVKGLHYFLIDRM